MAKLRYPLLWILLLSLPLQFLDIGRPAFTDGEAIYAETPREMRLRNDWITPYINGIRHFDKPPLLYWLTGFSQSYLGETETAARLWPALANWAVILIVGLIGSTLYGRRAGWLSALVFATCVGPYIFSRLVGPDPLLSFFVALAILAYARGFLEGKGANWRWSSLLFLALGLAGMIKGILGIGLPAAIIGLHALLSGRWRSFLSRPAALGSALLALLVLPWHLLMIRENPDFFGYYFINEHLLRFMGQRFPVDEFVSLPVFLALTLIWTFPWLPLLPHALAGAYHRLKVEKGHGEKDLLLLLWFFLIVILFSASRSRLEYYALPALPAFALLMGKRWDEWMQPDKQSFSRSAMLALAGMSLLLGLSAIAAFELLGPAHRILFDHFTTYWPASGWTGLGEQISALGRIRLPTFLVLSGAAVLTLSSAIALRNSRPGLGCGFLAGMMAPIFVLVHWGFLVMEPFQSSRPVAEILNRLDGDEVIVCLEPREYMWLGGVTFYTKRLVYVLTDPKFDGGGDHRRQPPDRFLKPEQFAQLWKSGKKVVLVLDQPEENPLVGALQVDGGHTVVRIGSRVIVANTLNLDYATGG